MVSAITHGVKVSVVTEYQAEYSNPYHAHFVFSYKIKIENESDFTVKLLRRHWYIYDANGLIREVEGEGVVGQQPTLEPGQSHEYSSGCNLNTSIGKMAGTYQMERVFDGKLFNVVIPDFTMTAPYRLN
ncbi:Co2+/Mg2+ efflux protein ApaG [Flectobacillus major]|jgi:ApaG protein|uniref:Co2+/Mg2+ efflux protein ApaG n=1 Tax=Flectobacillus major TaxID=103 RepID=UPI00041E8B3F|nr:Co2+/Mg2+ efflux protein ApaG [Flectobacillus major]